MKKATIETTLTKGKIAVSLDGAKVSIDKAVEIAIDCDAVALVKEGYYCMFEAGDGIMSLGKHNLKTAIRQFAKGEDVTGSTKVNGQVYDVYFEGENVVRDLSVEEHFAIIRASLARQAYDRLWDYHAPIEQIAKARQEFEAAQAEVKVLHEKLCAIWNAQDSETVAVESTETEIPGEETANDEDYEEDYAVSTEAQEVALDAEIELANANVEEISSNVETETDELNDTKLTADEDKTAERETARKEYAEAKALWDVICGDYDRIERLRNHCKDGSPKRKAYNKLLEDSTPLMKKISAKLNDAQHRHQEAQKLTTAEREALSKEIAARKAARDADFAARGIKYIATVYYFPHGIYGEDMSDFQKECKTFAEAVDFTRQEFHGKTYVGGIYEAESIIEDTDDNILAECGHCDLDELIAKYDGTEIETTVETNVETETANVEETADESEIDYDADYENRRMYIPGYGGIVYTGDGDPDKFFERTLENLERANDEDGYSDDYDEYEIFIENLILNDGLTREQAEKVAELDAKNPGDIEGLHESVVKMIADFKATNAQATAEVAHAETTTVTEVTATKVSTETDAEKLARLKSDFDRKQAITAERHADFGRVQEAYNRAVEDEHAAENALKIFGKAKSQELRETLITDDLRCAKGLTVTDTDGRTCEPDFNNIYIGFYYGDAKFYIQASAKADRVTLAEYTTPAEVTTAITALKSAIARGDTYFDFRTIEQPTTTTEPAPTEVETANVDVPEHLKPNPALLAEFAVMKEEFKRTEGIRTLEATAPFTAIITFDTAPKVTQVFAELDDAVKWIFFGDAPEGAHVTTYRIEDADGYLVHDPDHEEELFIPVDDELDEPTTDTTTDDEPQNDFEWEFPIPYRLYPQVDANEDVMLF